MQYFITASVLSSPQSAEYTTLLQSNLLRSNVDALDIETLPTIAIATIIAIIALTIILISSVPYYSSLKICTDIIIVGDLSAV